MIALVLAITAFSLIQMQDTAKLALHHVRHATEKEPTNA
jgi:hypothetical protein